MTSWLFAKWAVFITTARREWIETYEKRVFMISVVSVLLILALWKVPEWQARAYHGRLDTGAISKLDPKDLIQLQKDLITAENNARLTLAQIVGGLVVLLGLYATFKNVQVAQNNLRVTEEGKLTERFSKAVELLGSDKLDVRLGGIYALERIARDSQKDHWTVMEVLTAFVREHAKNEEYDRKPEPEGKPRTPAPDIKAALDVIGRRKWTDKEEITQILDLRDSALEGAIFDNAKFGKANFSYTDLDGAGFYNTDLSSAILQCVTMLGATCYLCNFEKAHLSDATLRRASIESQNFSGAILINADLRNARLNNTNFNNAILYGADLSGAALNGATLVGIDAREAKLREAVLGQADLSNANLAKSILDGADLIMARLSQSNLTQASLAKAYLTGADLSSAYLTGAILSGAGLYGANLRTAVGLTWEQLLTANFDESTQLPPDLEDRRKKELENKAE